MPLAFILYSAPLDSATMVAVTPSHFTTVGRQDPLCGGRRWWPIAIAILTASAFLIINQKSIRNSNLYEFMSSQETLNARITAVEAKHNEEKELLEAKIASLEAQLNIGTDGVVQNANLRAAVPHVKTNDCLHHINDIRGIRMYSQNDEDGVLLQILHCMGGHGTKEYFEFGSENGMEVNTRLLRELYGWHGHLLDGSQENPSIPLHKEFFTPSNIVGLMEKYNVGRELDVLSIDCDMDDFYVTREILVAGYRPRVLINEFNVNFGWDWSVATLPKPVGKETDPAYWWKKDCYFGASAPAFISLTKAFGYAPVYANTVNLMFVRIDQAEELGLSLPSPDIFPGPFVMAMHADCPMKTWKKIDSKAIANSVDTSISHVDFANSIDEIVLDCKTTQGRKRIASAYLPGLDQLQKWRVFWEVSDKGAKDNKPAASR